MEIHARTLTRRQLLRSAGLGAAGLTLTGAGGELVTGALASSPRKAPPTVPAFHSRSDLRIPSLTVTRNDPGASADAIFIAPYNAPNAQAGAVITDSTGEPIWENPVADKVTTNFRVQQYRGSPVLTWWEGIIELGHGVGEYVVADSSYETIRRVQATNGLRGDLHEFGITPRDTALLTSYVVTHADLTSVGGSRNGTIQDAIFQEIDLASGELLLEWHSQGRILWRLGGKSGDFSMGEGSEFAWQHDARRQPDGTLTVFDNGATPAVEQLSRGLILDVDERGMSAKLLAQYTHPGILAGSQGSVQLLANGNVFVGWGEVPRVSEFLHSGELVFDAVLGEKYECYRAFRMPWTGTPAEAPALALTGAGRGLTAYVSWNGATEVRSWQLLAGPEATSLSPVASTRATGFESALRAGSSGPYFAVNALDRWGRTLGTSSVQTFTS